jgi:hypothetical protein
MHQFLCFPKAKLRHTSFGIGFSAAMQTGKVAGAGSLPNDGKWTLIEIHDGFYEQIACHASKLTSNATDQCDFLRRRCTNGAVERKSIVAVLH